MLSSCAHISQIFDVCINLLKCATVPHVLGKHLQPVKDVLCNQPTPSGLKLVVQMNSIMIHPSITLDYDGVVEARYFFFFFENMF